MSIMNHNKAIQEENRTGCPGDEPRGDNRIDVSVGVKSVIRQSMGHLSNLFDDTIKCPIKPIPLVLVLFRPSILGERHSKGQPVGPTGSMVIPGPVSGHLSASPVSFRTLRVYRGCSIDVTGIMSTGQWSGQRVKLRTDKWKLGELRQGGGFKWIYGRGGVSRGRKSLYGVQ